MTWTTTPAGRRRAWILALLIPVTVVSYHWRAALPDMAFAGSDLRCFFYAIREAVAGALRQGHLPGWQRGIFLGYPLIADPQAAIFDLATWLTLPWDAPRALTLATLLHLTIAGWGMALWMRLRGLAAAEALLAALLFALGAKETVHIIHWNFAASTAWWPWMLAGLEGFAGREERRSSVVMDLDRERAPGKGRWLLLSSVATAACWFGGAPQMAYFGTLVAGLYALVLAPALWRHRRTDALRALASIPLGMALAAPMILPVAELVGAGPRGAGVSYTFATSWKWVDRWALALFLLPRSFGGHHAFSEMNLWEVTGYLGILPLGLAAAAPFLQRRGLWLFWLLGLLGIWVSFGEDSWLGLHHFLFRFLPGYNSFRNPTRLLMVTSLASALLAAEGLHALRAPEGSRGGRPRAGAVLIIVAALALILPRLPGFNLDVAAAQSTAWFTVALAAVGLAWLEAGLRLGRGPIWALAASAIFAADAYLAFGTMNQVAPAASDRPLLSEFAPLLPGPGGRVGVIAKWGQTANATLRQGWEGVTGYSPMCIQRVRSLIEATHDDQVRPPGPTSGDTNFPRPRPASRLWSLFGAPLVISDRPQPLPHLATGEREWEQPLVAYRAEALPRVFWTGSWIVADDTHAAGAMLEAAQGDRAVLAEPPPSGIAPGSPGGPVAADSLKVGQNWLEATLSAPRAGLVVVLDPFFPGWSARLDGRPTTLLRANFAFQAVAVDAGRHTLRLEYHNRWVALGAGVAAGTLLLVALLTRRRRKEAYFFSERTM